MKRTCRTPGCVRKPLRLTSGITPYCRRCFDRIVDAALGFGS